MRAALAALVVLASSALTVARAADDCQTYPVFSTASLGVDKTVVASPGEVEVILKLYNTLPPASGTTATRFIVYEKHTDPMLLIVLLNGDCYAGQFLIHREQFHKLVWHTYGQQT